MYRPHTTLLVRCESIQLQRGHDVVLVRQLSHQLHVACGQHKQRRLHSALIHVRVHELRVLFNQLHNSVSRASCARSQLPHVLPVNRLTVGCAQRLIRPKPWWVVRYRFRSLHSCIWRSHRRADQLHCWRWFNSRKQRRFLRMVRR